MALASLPMHFYNIFGGDVNGKRVIIQQNGKTRLWPPEYWVEFINNLGWKSLWGLSIVGIRANGDRTIQEGGEKGGCFGNGSLTNCFTKYYLKCLPHSVRKGILFHVSELVGMFVISLPTPRTFLSRYALPSHGLFCSVWACVGNVRICKCELCECQHTNPLGLRLKTWLWGVAMQREAHHPCIPKNR